MKKVLWIAAVLFASVSCYDDSKLWESINDHENRISELERLCAEMNTNIYALHSLVLAHEKNDYITNVTPVESNGQVVGYTISFAKGTPITIYHGHDGADGANGADGAPGQDGQTPVIGVHQDIDGVYYWTLNGEWLLDASGNKIPTTGKDGAPGQDGITPQLKIEDGYWYVSYDNGGSWVVVGQATGDQGPQGNPGVNGDSMFADIDYSTSNEYVTFVLTNGTQIQIPTWYAFEALKAQCERINSNIEALQSIVSALEGNDYVTEVIPVVENGKEVGYIIKFSKSGSMTIYHGQDGADGANGADGVPGQDGQTPDIGVRQDIDGDY